uniref:Uncharacterized protein n=1 Tax=Anguilla anguilla TaxID=7936 RepID=A0A0E9T8J8_ANGAN
MREGTLDHRMLLPLSTLSAFHPFGRDIFWSHLSHKSFFQISSVIFIFW